MTLGEQLKYGLSEGLIDLTAYIMGDGKVPYIPYDEDSDWREHFVKYENQSIPGFETFNCTGFATTTQIETQLKMLYGIEENYSDRWVGIISGTRHGYGNDPQNVYEAIRKYGLIPEKMLPFSNDIDSAEEYFSFKGADKEACYAEGRRWLEKYEMKHEWLWNRRPENYMEVIHDAMKTCSVAFSVDAWRKENGEYVSRGDGNNHWTLGVFFDGGSPVAFDTYKDDNTNLKKLSSNHNIKKAKRIWINKRTNSSMRKHISILEEILKRLKLMKPTFFDVCKSALGTDASPNDEAPDELACANTVTELMRKVYPETPKINGTWTLWEYLKNPKNNWAEVKTYEPGTIILSPTGTGTGTGHVGVVMEDGLIASNNSFGPNKGKFTVNYTRETWNSKYAVKQRMPVLLYRRVV